MQHNRILFLFQSKLDPVHFNNNIKLVKCIYGHTTMNNSNFKNIGKKKHLFHVEIIMELK